MPTVEIVLNHFEIENNIPYRLVAEARFGYVWDTLRRRRNWNEMFSPSEQEQAEKLFTQARNWYMNRGIPESVRMTLSTYALWHKLAQFCASLYQHGKF